MNIAMSIGPPDGSGNLTSFVLFSVTLRCEPRHVSVFSCLATWGLG